ncbi:hypothetical protein SNEBB_003061 [Seison nebaliae]|nr:hypothetical protein SNEBB_003061 [Seison nebaliae]
MTEIFECVPNFSEGKDLETISKLRKCLEENGVYVADVSAEESTNRSVFTLFGSSEVLLKGLIGAAHIAADCIDMRNHKGEHARMGAIDVCPFIPLSNVTMVDCIELSKRFGKKLSEELNVSVFLYEESQPKEYRKSLAKIRQGEYEGMKEKIKEDKWKPDFNGESFNEKWGATAIGAREFLIAYNVNILSTKEEAHRIALNLRETGRNDTKPGKLKNLRGVGWYLASIDMTQISFNLTNYHITGLGEVYDNCLDEAKKLNLSLLGSEIVGVVPLQAMLNAAQYFIDKEDLLILSTKNKLQLIINRLGLGSDFDPSKKIIEYLVKNEEKEKEQYPYYHSTLYEFNDLVGKRSAVPGGGSVAAYSVSQGANLLLMAASLSRGNVKFYNQDQKIRPILTKLYDLREKMIYLPDEDCNYYNESMKTLRNKSSTEEEKSEATINAAVIPLRVMKLAVDTMSVGGDLHSLCNSNVQSDYLTGMKCLEAGCYGAYQNVQINLKDVEDVSLTKKMLEDSETYLKKSKLLLETNIY